MTPEAQRISCAELCGLKYHKPTEDEIKSGSYYQYEPRFLEDWNTRPELLHIIEERGLEAAFYACIAGREAALSQKIVWQAISMTQPQFVECVLRTCGKWEDGE